MCANSSAGANGKRRANVAAGRAEAAKKAPASMALTGLGQIETLPASQFVFSTASSMQTVGIVPRRAYFRLRRGSSASPRL